MDAQSRDRFALCAHILKAMAHPTRLYIVNALMQREQCVFMLTDMIGADMSTVSRHLKVLKDAGLIKDEKRGMQVYYHLSVPCVKLLDRLDAIVRQIITPQVMENNADESQ
ncbi:transcriptional regulator, ArsR family [Candidatus Vecturithrix granuli]|uniref:Transcriptional regulator, ArsR family n=1 Tax=Vecturithrix granuli TaxID=1499967 RepID=A0A081BWX4_VECG1|nr:transcriptional regulator, ArsR family [Candidatus Vecturithrix granuli]